jgi:hypothetical protein
MGRPSRPCLAKATRPFGFAQGQAMGAPIGGVGTAALGCPVERSSAAFGCMWIPNFFCAGTTKSLFSMTCAGVICPFFRRIFKVKELHGNYFKTSAYAPFFRCCIRSGEPPRAKRIRNLSAHESTMRFLYLRSRLCVTTGSCGGLWKNLLRSRIARAVNRRVFCRLRLVGIDVAGALRFRRPSGARFGCTNLAWR